MICSVLALSAGILGWNRIWFPHRMFSPVWFAAFILIPVLILMGGVFILSKITGKHRSY
jgi:hypothetical protein